MAYCTNCGKEMMEDAAFCMSCGQAKDVGQPSQTSQPSKGLVAEIQEICMSIILRPVSALSEFIGRPLGSTVYVLAGALLLLQALVTMWGAKRLEDAVMGGLNDFLGYALQEGMSQLGVGDSVFSYSLLFYAMTLVGLALGIVLTGKYVLKGEAEIANVFNAAVFVKVPAVVVLLATILVTYISPLLGTLIYLFGMLLIVAYVAFALKEVAGVSADKTVYGVPLVYLVMYFVLYLTCNVVG